METAIKKSSVNAIDNRIPPEEPEQYIIVPFEYFITDTTANWPGKKILVLRFTNPYNSHDIQLNDTGATELIEIDDEERLERYAKNTVKEYIEFHTNLK